MEQLSGSGTRSFASSSPQSSSNGIVVDPRGVVVVGRVVVALVPRVVIAELVAAGSAAVVATSAMVDSATSLGEVNAPTELKTPAMQSQ